MTTSALVIAACGWLNQATSGGLMHGWLGISFPGSMHMLGARVTCFCNGSHFLDDEVETIVD